MNKYEKIKEMKQSIIKDMNKLNDELEKNNIRMMCSFEDFEITEFEDMIKSIDESWIIDTDNNSIDCEDQDVRVGDYFVYEASETGDIKLAKICKNDDLRYQVYFPIDNIINSITTDTPFELYEEWDEYYDYVELIQVEDNDVYELEIGEKYFLFTEGTYYIVKCIYLEGEYSLEDENSSIAKSYCIEELLNETLIQFPIIKKIRQENYATIDVGCNVEYNCETYKVIKIEKQYGLINTNTSELYSKVFDSVEELHKYICNNL